MSTEETKNESVNATPIPVDPALVPVGQTVRSIAKLASQAGPYAELLEDGTVRFSENFTEDAAARQIIEHVAPRVVVATQLANMASSLQKMEAMGQLKLITANNPNEIKNILSIRKGLNSLIEQFDALNEQGQQ